MTIRCIRIRTSLAASGIFQQGADAAGKDLGSFQQVAATEAIAAWTGQRTRPHISISTYAAAGRSPDLSSQLARLCSRTGVPNIAIEKKRSLSAVPRKNGIAAL